MTIRAKLYAAIVLTSSGRWSRPPWRCTGWTGWATASTRCRTARQRQALALELKFDVTDFNGWQTAYGYDNGASRPRFEPRCAQFRSDLAHGAEASSPTRARRGCSNEHQQPTSADFMALDDVAYAALQARRPRAREADLPRARAAAVRRDGRAAEQLARYEARRATATQETFDDAREDSRRGLIAVALGAALVIILLLVTASDIARLALEERTRVPRMTDDIFLTLSLLLMGALLARFVATLLRIPEILLLVAVGALFGPSALDVVDVPFDSLGAQLIFTLGVSLILFYGGLIAVAAGPAHGVVGR